MSKRIHQEDRLSVPFHSHLARLPVYEPGRPIEDVARELGLDPKKIIKLASNENPLGPSPKAIEAVQKIASEIHIYPDGNSFHLRTAIARQHGLALENVVLGNGSNEIIELLGHVLLGEGTEMVISDYAFAIYEIVARLFNAKVVQLPAVQYGHDLDAMVAAITPSTRLMFIANPNNPTGTVVPKEQLLKTIESVPDHVILVVDEAYQEFLIDPLDTPKLIQKHPNLVVMRTFSKAQGLAGLRVGYGLGSPEVVAMMQKSRQPFHINLPAQMAALAALQDHDHIQKTIQLVRDQMPVLESGFHKRKIEYVSSGGNFIMANVGKGRQIFQELLKKGVIVRPLEAYRLPEWIRVTVGTAAQNESFFRALDQVLTSY